MDNSVATPVKYLGPHHFPGPSASHSLVLVLKPKTQEGGGYLSRVSAYRPTPLFPLFRPPPAPPRLQLAPGTQGLRCAGVVEFYSGTLGGTISHEDGDRTQNLGDLICAALQCGSFLKYLLEEAEAVGTRGPGERGPLPVRWKIQNASCTSLEQCFRKAQPWESGQGLALVCSGE